MDTGRTDEFCRDAVRIALTSGLSRHVIMLGRQQPHETRSGDPGTENVHRPAVPVSGLHLPQRSRRSLPWGANPRVRRHGDDPMGDYAFGWIRAELGLQEHRK